MFQVQKEIAKPKEIYLSIDAAKIGEEEIPMTEIKVTNFSNRIFIIVTQLNKLGVMVRLIRFFKH
jgi:hypothetical protein